MMTPKNAQGDQGRRVALGMRATKATMSKGRRTAAKASEACSGWSRRWVASERCLSVNSWLRG